MTGPAAVAAAPPANDFGIHANGNVHQAGGQVAGRDLVINQGFRINSRLQKSAKVTLTMALTALMSGVGLAGAYNLVNYMRLVDAFERNSPTAPELLPTPFLAIGYGLSFTGFTLLIVALCLPRDRTISPINNGHRR
jgi:hypothetical protein